MRGAESDAPMHEFGRVLQHHAEDETTGAEDNIPCIHSLWTAKARPTYITDNGSCVTAGSAIAAPAANAHKSISSFFISPHLST